jgi:dolichol-phosphate mannosyltransferase
MFSLVIPLFNEVNNIKPLIDEISESLKKFQKYEVILINDASTDETLNKIESIKNNKIRIISNTRNLGQSFSIHSGVKYSKYNIIVTLDGDGQNNPADIPRLLEYYLSNDDIFLVGGIRAKRMDSVTKVISSKVANMIRSFILKDDCKDTGCSLKVFDKKIFLKLPYFNGIHRFLPALFKGYGYNTNFIEVSHRKRKYGNSKYGTINRLFRGIRDIVRVNRIIKNNNKY